MLFFEFILSSIIPFIFIGPAYFVIFKGNIAMLFFAVLFNMIWIFDARDKKKGIKDERFITEYEREKHYEYKWMARVVISLVVTAIIAVIVEAK
jgi:hypothetical protein